MPRQNRLIPQGINRFNYWEYATVRPRVQRPAYVLPTSAHANIQRQFHAVWHGSDEGAKLEIQLIYGKDSDKLRDRPFLALQYYAEHDKLWEQDPDAQRLLKELSPPKRQKIESLTRKWHVRKKLDWRQLLETIATDQAFFRELIILGPTEAGLIDTKRRVTQPLLHERFNLSMSSANRVYRHYNKQLRKCLGLGTLAPKRLRPWLKKVGLLDENGKVINEPVAAWLDKRAPTERERYSDVALHWFNHCLRNLAERKNGRRDRPLDPNNTPCANTCYDYQKKLTSHQYSCDPPPASPEA
jgi:hypothetical protein